jgi:hypothetical protein
MTAEQDTECRVRSLDRIAHWTAGEESLEHKPIIVGS